MHDTNDLSGYSKTMRSKLAEQSRSEMIELCRKMSPAERLQAFVNHSRTLAEIYRAGAVVRRQRQIAPERPKTASHP